MSDIKQEDIALEGGLLKVLSNKSHFEQYEPSIDYKRLIPGTARLLQDYKEYFNTYKHDDIDWQLFYTEFSQNYRNRIVYNQRTKKKEVECDELDLAYYRETVFPLIQNSSTEGIIDTLIKRTAVETIKNSIESGYDDAKLLDIIGEFKEKRSQFTISKDEDIFNLSDLDLEVLDSKRGIGWFLPSLQANLSSIMPGQFIVVAADSDVGKSAFCISQAVHVFKQVGRNTIENQDTCPLRPILYCTSEDTKEDLACRFLSCLYKDRVLGGFEEIVSNFKNVSKSFNENFNSGAFIGMSIRGAQCLNKIKDKIKKYNPCLVIIDMLDKLSSSDNIQDLTRLYQDVRGIANDGYAIIGTSQTGNTSFQDKDTKEYRHRRWLTDKDLANSKSGKQGAAYCMIMIGKDDDVPNIRYLSTTKKKRGKHVNVTCEIDDAHSCYKELL